VSEPIEGPMQVYRSQLAAGRFVLQRCGDCQRAIFYPRVICPHCASRSLNWVDASGEGTVYSSTVVSRRPEQGGNYNVALIDLAEGARMMSRVEGLAPEQVAIGQRVRHAIVQQDGEAVLVFRLA
jgi:uncharacterized protein